MTETLGAMIGPAGRCSSLTKLVLAAAGKSAALAAGASFGLEEPQPETAPAAAAARRTAETTERRRRIENTDSMDRGSFQVHLL
jgi:hypothetical protein